MSSAAAASPVTSWAARKARGQCSRKSRSRSATDPCWAPLIQARSATRRLYDADRPRGPYGVGTSRGPDGRSAGHEDVLRSSSSLAAVLLPSAAVGAACSPLNCAPSQFSLAGRPAARLPELATRARHDRRSAHRGRREPRCRAGVVGGTLLVHLQGTTLTWYDATSGEHGGHGRAAEPAPGSSASRRTASRRSASARRRRLDDVPDRLARGECVRSNVPGAAVGLRRAARRQPLPDQVPVGRRLPGAAAARRERQARRRSR